jgi:hypothetical protein
MGTLAGTFQLRDINVGSGHSMGLLLNGAGSGIAIGATLAIFAANDGVAGAELWATDGTSNGTRLSPT